MYRLFVALRPSPRQRSALLDMMGGVAGARWQSDEQLHLTLRFIGEVERPLAEDLAAALDRVAAQPPIVAPHGVGTFEQAGRVHTLWAGISPDVALQHLQRRVERVVTACGIAPERRVYHPHITLARFGRTGGALAPFLERHAGFTAPAEQVSTFCLYESHLGRDGASYSVVARYPLG